MSDRSPSPYESGLGPFLHERQVHPLGVEDAVHRVELTPRERHTEAAGRAEVGEPVTQV